MSDIHMVTREEMLRDMADPDRRDREALKELQKRHNDMFDRYMDLNFALGLVTGYFPPFNELTKTRAEKCLAARKAEWFEKNPTLKE